MIKFENFELSKSLGKLNGAQGIGVSVNVNAEVISAEYEKDSENKIKASKAGNKRVKLYVKTVDEITKNNGEKVNIPSFMNVTYYETDYSPKLKEVKPTEKLRKFVQVKFNTGGLIPEGKESVFGSFKIRNYKGQDGSPKNSVAVFGGNVATPRKVDGTYIIKAFDGSDMVFVADNKIEVKVKGIIKPIKDTEDFIKSNYDETAKRLKFELYYMENTENPDYDTTMPCILENIEKNRVMDFIKFVKSSENTVIGLHGWVKSTPIYGEAKEDTSGGRFGEYSYGGGRDILGYEAGMLIKFDEAKNNWEIMITKNKGELKVGEVEIEGDNSMEFPF